MLEESVGPEGSIETLMTQAKGRSLREEEELSHSAESTQPKILN